MADKVYPSAKPATTNAAAVAPAAGTNPNFPANKAQLYSAARASYRPQPPPRRRHRRGCCCRFCLCTTLLILTILLIAAVAGGVFYLIYRPHRPSFAVASLHLSKFNLTNTAVTSAFNFTLTARNPNRKITFSYDPISVKFFSGDVGIGEGSIRGFTQGRRNVTNLRTVVSNSSPFKQGTDISELRSSLRSRNLPLKIQLDAKVKVKIGGINTKKISIRVTCDGIRISIPTGKTTSSLANTSNVRCKVDPRIKIIKWTV